MKSDIRGIEKQFESEQFKLKSMVFLADDFFPNAGTYDLEQPLVYVRTDKEFHVQPEVKYYFTPDDTVRLITHSWDTKGVSKNINYNQDFSKSKEQDIEQWNSKYGQLRSVLTSELGTPTEGTGELESKSKSGYGVWKERNLKWEANGCTTELKMIWTEQDTQLSEYLSDSSLDYAYCQGHKKERDYLVYNQQTIPHFQYKTLVVEPDHHRQ